MDILGHSYGEGNGKPFLRLTDDLTSLAEGIRWGGGRCLAVLASLGKFRRRGRTEGRGKHSPIVPRENSEAPLALQAELANGDRKCSA